jgi:hypothetical protein
MRLLKRRRDPPPGREEERRPAPASQIPADSPAILYHYTTSAGLLGIIESKSLWASDAEFLNDAQELRFGRERLYEALLGAAAELDGAGAPPEDRSRARLIESAASHLNPGSSPFLGRQAHAAFITCFCEAGDLLSQWRGYGHSGGYAIGFRTAEMADFKPDDRRSEIPLPENAVLDDTPPNTPRLFQVRYGQEAVEAMVSEVLPRVAAHPVGHPGATGFFTAKALVIPALATVKDPAFAEEREWRMIAMGWVGDGGFRAGPFGIVPYMTVEFPLSAVAEIVVGPGQFPEMRKAGVERMLSKYRMEGVEVRLSAAPFRG